MFPGPTLEVNNGDTLEVKVHNRARYNITIHWYILHTSIYFLKPFRENTIMLLFSKNNWTFKQLKNTTQKKWISFFTL